MTHDERVAFEEANEDIFTQQQDDDFNSRVDLFVKSWREAGAYITYDQQRARTFHYRGAKLTEQQVQDAFRVAVEKHNYRGKYPEKWRSLVIDRLAAKLTLVAGEVFLPNGPDFVCVTTGVHYINIWRPYVVMETVLEDGTEPDLSFFFELVERIIPDKEQREYFYDWLADLIQHPENRKPVGLYFVSEEGTGKGRFIEWLVEKLVVYQCKKSSVLPVSSTFGFTGYDRCLLAVFDDFGKVPATTTRKMKNCISENSILIEEKGKDPRQAPVYFRTIVFTNEMGAYPLSAGDRRWTVFSYVDHKISKEETLDFMTRFKAELIRCGEKPMVHGAPGAAYVSAVYQWLMAREYNEDRLYLPLETDFGNQIKGAKTEDQKGLEDLLEPYDAVTVAYIKSALSLANRDNDIADMLQAAGWHKQENGVDQLGKRCRTWYRPEAFRDGHSAKYLRGHVNVPRDVDPQNSDTVADQTTAPELTEPSEELQAAFENDAQLSPEAAPTNAPNEEGEDVFYVPKESVTPRGSRAEGVPDAIQEQPADNASGFWMWVNGVKTWYDLTTGSGEKPVELIPDDQLPACMCG
ncbi:primase-helicase family protein [Escherichia coli]|uniref:primase-helicase family protein n=1 Tax=Escherichia coli TaxID=562 RepID=UPI000539A477|nr:primase-helicase family protein [Escherichia coli]